MAEIARILIAFLYGIVEGITEWLPISSTGHLILLGMLFPLDSSAAFWEMFLVVIQFGAILAVLTLYRKRLDPFPLCKTAAEASATRKLWFKIFLAVLPTVALAPLDHWMETHLHTGAVVAIMLILYGIFFLWMERRPRLPRVLTVEEIDAKYALGIGCFQALAVIPGTSRSGATILGAMLLGLSRGAAAEFSFFMAIPTMAGASLLKIGKYIINEGTALTGKEWLCLLIGCGTAYLVSLLTIRYLMDFVKRHTFSGFGIYRILLGTLILILLFIFK